MLLPFYWVLHSIATVRAAIELLTRPHFWAKTTHGLTRLQRSFEGEPEGTEEAEPPVPALPPPQG